MVNTGKKKFLKVASSTAFLAEPENSVFVSIQPQSASIGDIPNLEEARRAIKITPDTYSGVAVEAIENVDRVRSKFEPSRIPARIPTIKAIGTINNKTKPISLPVADKRLATSASTSVLNTEE